MPHKKPVKLFLGGLSPKTTSNTLDEYFAAYGNVVESIIVVDWVTCTSRCFGFVEFSDPASAAAAKEGGPHTIDGRIIHPKPSQQRARTKRSRRSNKIFIGGIPSSMSEADLKAFFERFGEVADATIISENDSDNNESLRYGCITFLSRSSMESALEEQFVFLEGERVEIKKSLPRDFGIILNNRVSTNLSQSQSQSQTGYLTTICQQCSAYNTSIVPKPYPAWGPPSKGPEWPQPNLFSGAGFSTTADKSKIGDTLIMYVKERKETSCFGFCYTVDAEPIECIYSYKCNDKSNDRSNWILQEMSSPSKPKKSFTTIKILFLIFISIACMLFYGWMYFDDTEMLRKLFFGEDIPQITID